MTEHNPILQSLFDRKSVRVYEEKPIPAEMKQAMLEAAAQAPSAGCQQLYTILDITDPALKARLADLCDHQPFIAKAPLVLGQSFESAEEINQAMACVKGNPFAHAAIEIAWWTMQSKLTKTPLHTLLGGSDDEIDTGADFGRQPSLDRLMERIDGAIREGYKRIKLKAMPGWDLEMLQAVRSTFPKFTFHIDCNAGYTLDDLPMFEKIDKLGLAMIEQPLFHADVVDHAKLQSRLETPICLDESISSVYMTSSLPYFSISRLLYSSFIWSIGVSMICSIS